MTTSIPELERALRGLRLPGMTDTLQERRYMLSGLPERKALQELDWSGNMRPPKGDIFELGTLKFVDAREDILPPGPPGTGKSHVAKALALLAVDRALRSSTGIRSS
jgi:DNA replication protein DnaC